MQIKPFILSAPMTAVVAIAVSVRSVCGEGFSRFWIFLRAVLISLLRVLIVLPR